jgi:hypothetical protein
LFSIQIFLACYFEGTNLSDALKPWQVSNVHKEI